MKVFGYVRVSTDEQASEGRSLDIQTAQIEKYCELYGHALVDMLVDAGVSASVPLERRQGGAELIDRLFAGEAEGFVVQRLDRAFRITTDGLITADGFNRRGLSIHSVNEHIDTASPMGWYFLTLILANAELERNRTRERSTEVSVGLREQGRVWGPVPYGCVRVGDRLFRDPAIWQIRQWMVSHAKAAGRGGSLSLRALAIVLQERGVPAPGGGKLWHISTLSGLVRHHGDIEHIPMLSDGNDTAVSIGEGVSDAATGGF